MNKKAMSAAFLVSIIITLTAFIVIAPLVGKFVGEDEKKIERLCHDTVAFRASSMLSVDATIVKGELKTPVFCKVIDKRLEGDKEELMGQIAQKMARCWWQFNEGRFEEILKGADFDVLFFGTDKLDNDCFMCYSLIIDEKEIESTTDYPAENKITAEEMADYLRENKAPRTDVTYLEYFQSGEKGGPGVVGILTQEILPDQAYGVSFLAKNEPVRSTAGEGVTKLIAATVIVGVAAATVGPGLIVLGVSTGLAASGFHNLKTHLYNEDTERDVSMIYLDDLKSAQENCFEGDLGGI